MIESIISTLGLGFDTQAPRSVGNTSSTENRMDELLRELAEIQATAQVRSDYAKTLALLRALKAGEITLDNVTMTADGWSVAAVELKVASTEESQAETA